MAKVDKNKIKNTEITVCPIEKTLGILGGKWTTLIIRDLLDGTKRFGELSRSLEGISPRTLSLRLSELEKEGILIKKIYPEVPPRVEYSLTEQGEALTDIIAQMREWGTKYRLQEK